MTETFIRRPITTTLVMAGILLFGIIGYRQLPVSDLPTVDYPTITVSASLEGANPETMAAAVATPLEKQFSTIPGVDAITSASGQGSTVITLQFALSRGIDAAAQDVQTAISKSLRQLPLGMQPPSYSKSNPADSPILYYALTSATLPLATLDEYAETVLAQHISSIDGVAQVGVQGAQKYAVRVQLDPRALVSRHLGIDEVTTAITKNNVNSPAGVLWGRYQALSLQANGQLADAAAFRPMIVAYRDGSPIRLSDLGSVVDGVENPRSGSWYNGTRAIVLTIQRQPGTNTVRVADAVRAAVDSLRAQVPPAVTVGLLYDRSQSIRESVSDVKFTLALTLCLVVMVIFLFLRNAPATVIPSLALPMSIFGTFAVMAMLGYSIDNLSMMALTLSVGFVVDDAIVMLENIVRHIEAGKAVLPAALEASREIGFTIVSMTLSLSAVFIPILFMGGLLGRLFHEFAVVIGTAILVSGFISLSLTPMMSSRFLRRGHASSGRLYQVTERVFQAALDLYHRTLAWVMQHRPLTMAFSLVILVANVGLFALVQKGFIPSQDTGIVYGTVEAREGTSYDDLVAHLQEVSAIAQQDPSVAGVMVAGGGSGAFSGSGNQGRITVYLKPRGERPAGADAVIRALTPRLAQVPGVRTYLNNPPAIRVGGRVSKSQYQFTLQSSDLQALELYATTLQGKLETLPSLTDVTSDLQIKNPQITIDIDRERAAALGLDVDQIQGALYDAYGSRQVSTILAPNNEYEVVLELLPQFQRDPSALNLLNIRSKTGALVPLGAVGSITQTLGPLTVNHSGQLPSVTLSFNLRPGTSLGDAVTSVQQVARQTLPSTIATTFGGSAAAFQQSQSGLFFLLLVAIAVIYLVLGVLYESFIHPLTILSALPFATFGALLTLLVLGTELDIYAYVGLIMLVGLVKKNGIMMIDFALDVQRNEGKAPAEAIVDACLIRFRPIMMTTMAALMGTLPIAIGFGAGAEARRPLGITVVGGLLVSQLVTLYVTPVVYTYLDEVQQWGREWWRQRRGRRVLESQPAGAD